MSNPLSNARHCCRIGVRMKYAKRFWHLSVLPFAMVLLCFEAASAILRGEFDDCSWKVWEE